MTQRNCLPLTGRCVYVDVEVIVGDRSDYDCGTRFIASLAISHTAPSCVLSSLAAITRGSISIILHTPFNWTNDDGISLISDRHGVDRIPGD